MGRSTSGFARALAVTAGAAMLLGSLATPAQAATGAKNKKRTASTQQTLRVVTYNVCKPTCMAGKYSWANRRQKVAKITASFTPDVVLIQEASTLPYAATTQWADLAGLLRHRNLRIATMKDGCTDYCTRGSHVFYDPDTVEPMTGLYGPTTDPAPPDKCMKYWDIRDELAPRRKLSFYDDWYNLRCHKYMQWEPIEDLSAGMVSQQMISNTSWGDIKDRNISWAFLRDKATGTAFMAISLHLPPDKTALGEQVRRAVATALPGWSASLAASLNLSGIPTFIGGDLNSFQKRQPQGAHRILERAGFTDGFDAKIRVNPRYATINKNGRFNDRYRGWPPKPYKYGYAATRIDYVFAKGFKPLRHETFIKLRKNGTFDNAWRASDHNPVITDWAVG